MAAGKWFCLFLVSSIFDSTFGNPAGCSEKAGNYDSVRPVRCTKSGTLSNTFSTFSWQRLEVTEYQTGVSAGDFSGFSSASTTSFDSSYPHSLTIVCKPGITSFTVAANAFSQFPNVQVLEFLNCPITSIPANAFPGHYLDHLIFTGGKIGSIDANAFSGLNISKLSIPGAVGGITINSELTSGLPEKVFDSLQSMEYLAIDEAKVSTITVGMVGNLTNLRYLNLRNNLITNITDGIFTNMKSLSYLDFEGNKFTCTCTDLWFLKYTAENHIHLLGGPLCETPASHNTKRVTVYDDEVCAVDDVCGGTAGLAMGGSCMPLYQLASYLLLLIILILSCVALGCICKTRKELTRVQRRMKNKRASSWNRVQEAMKQRSGAKQKPPVGKNGWV
ncbi:toll-like receptor 13 [Ostrea edulis]|uniref:toll-like receptor 13 n=1 Tax=Ostrea edulis TaxID=37623 RepID=UPI0024AF3979|nr:toll-like receptor 13 [Ostrea edulis]